MSETLSPERRCERVRMALAEAGYPDARAYSTPVEDDGGVVRIVGHVPDEVCWRAWALAGEPTMARSVRSGATVAAPPARGPSPNESN